MTALPPQAAEVIATRLVPPGPEELQLAELGAIASHPAAGDSAPRDVPSLAEIMALVRVAKAAEDPERALDDSLLAKRSWQQGRFDALPAHAKADPWIQARQDEILRQLQLTHDLARHILKTVVAPRRAA